MTTDPMFLVMFLSFSILFFLAILDLLLSWRFGSWKRKIMRLTFPTLMTITLFCWCILQEDDEVTENIVFYDGWPSEDATFEVVSSSSRVLNHDMLLTTLLQKKGDDYHVMVLHYIPGLKEGDVVRTTRIGDVHVEPSKRTRLAQK